MTFNKKSTFKVPPCISIPKPTSSKALMLESYMKIQTCADFGVAHAPPAPPLTSSLIEFYLECVLCTTIAAEKGLTGVESERASKSIRRGTGG